ncbi:MAG: glycoside hydrolase family 92 protein [Bacteroides sp.]|nr:glycoside hydrolase family 92 protein [Bacteroides sp.]
MYMRQILSLFMTVVLAHTAVGMDLTRHVDPYIGTGGHGHVFLGANVPFGMVQLGPSQPVKGWDWCSGYHYSDSILVGFSHLHLGGTGIGDLGDITFFPTNNPDVRRSRFSHDRESVMPGYYRVTLDDAGVDVELTAGTRTGFHRYNFADSDTAHVIVDLAYGIGWDKETEGKLTKVSDTAVEGYRYSSGWAKDQKIYFYAEFSRPMIECVNPDSLIVDCVFAPSSSPLEAKVALSPVSIDGAKANFAAEASGVSFDMARNAAKDRWNDNLSRAVVTGGDDAQKRVFYTALYHAMTAPVTFSDVTAEHPSYTVFSLWDTYRAAHPLYTLLYPEMQSDIAASFMDIYSKQGKLPVWHLHGNETDCMVGNPGVIVLGDMIMKGFVEDTASAYNAMKVSAMLDERSLDALKKYGYLPYDVCGNRTVAMGLEYAIADGAIAAVGAKLGDKDNYFARRAKSYEKYFDKKTGFMRARDTKGHLRDGEFDPFAATHDVNDYCEGNAWQYIWLVSHDPHGLIRLFGSEDRFIEKLDSLYVVEGDLGENASPDVSGLIGQYAHGNEPGHHTIYLYNYAGHPDKSAPLLRKVMTELYTDAPDGLSGNEDVGQMSSWYVLSSMGLYQVEPCGGRFVIGTPLFDTVTIALPDGKSFSVVADNNSAENIYVRSATLNGRPYTKGYIDFNDIVAGGELRLQMGATPSDFAKAKKDRP